MKKNKNNYLEIINKVEKVRSKNNINWMNILRLAFKHAPKEASRLMKKINSEDKRISFLLKKLSSIKKDFNE
jgi:hypothetical protein